MKRIYLIILLSLFPLAEINAASLCGEAGCDIQLNFFPGGGISSDQGFTIDLGTGGHINDPAVAHNQAPNTAQIGVLHEYSELTFSEGGVIVIIGGNIRYPDQSRVQINGLGKVLIKGGSHVVIGSIDTPGTVSFRSPKVEFANSEPSAGVFFGFSPDAGSTQLEASTAIAVDIVKSAAMIDFLDVAGVSACQLTGDNGVSLAADTFTLPENCTSVAEGSSLSGDAALKSILVGQVATSQEISSTVVVESNPASTSATVRSNGPALQGWTPTFPSRSDLAYAMPIATVGSPSGDTVGGGFLQLSVVDESYATESYIVTVIAEPAPVTSEVRPDLSYIKITPYQVSLLDGFQENSANLETDAAENSSIADDEMTSSKVEETHSAATGAPWLILLLGMASLRACIARCEASRKT